MDEYKRDRPAKLARWKARLDKERFFIPRDRGALWTGIGSKTAKILAGKDRLMTLEMTPIGELVDEGGLFSRELDRDFGSHWIAEKREIFRVLSKRFAESLWGTVTIYVPADFARPRNGAPGSFAFAVKVLWDELRLNDFGDPRVIVHRVTALRICWVRNGEVERDQWLTKEHTSAYLH